jgi:hypothetical protein
MLGAIGAIVVANVDNVARPFIYRRISRIHPMITLVGAFAGIRYFGVLGVLFGPLGLAYFFEVLALYRREFAAAMAPGDAAALGTRRAPAGEPAAAQPQQLSDDGRQDGGRQNEAPVGEA